MGAWQERGGQVFQEKTLPNFTVKTAVRTPQKHGTAARKEFLQQDMARPTQGANTGVSGRHSLGNS